MVNTNDFRRYSYDGDAAYALDAFNRTRSSAAPEIQPRRKRRLTVSPNTQMKSRKELVREQKKAFAQVVEILTVTVLVLAMLFGVLFTYVQKNELTKSIANIQDDIAVAQSENVSLNAELEALVSVSQIDSYAVEKLGMTRLQSNQIRYIDTSQYKQNHAAAAAVAEE
ncbi:MAG TPA: cell division protein FtsL [Candidatus Eubacterium faecavium]|nr:cell division protein FtsL [Candidatus Eubacterium faecavium]